MAHLENSSDIIWEASSEGFKGGAEVGPVVLAAEALPYIGNMEAFLTAPEAVETGTALAETVAEEVIEGSTKSVPNPNGKKGGVAHQNTINSIKNTSANGKIQYESKYNTPNGYKQSRYADWSCVKI